MNFEEAKKKIKEIIRDSQPIENNYDVQQMAKSILAVLGDLHHTFEDLEGKCEEYAKLVAGQAEAYAEKWKTLKELLDEMPKMKISCEGHGVPIFYVKGKVVSERYMGKWFEKAEKLLEDQSK